MNKYITINGKICHAHAPVGQKVADTVACGGCGYHVCSCPKAKVYDASQVSATFGIQPGNYTFRVGQGLMQGSRVVTVAIKTDVAPIPAHTHDKEFFVSWAKEIAAYDDAFNVDGSGSDEGD